MDIGQTIDSTMDRLLAIKTNREQRKVVGQTVKCLKESCKKDYAAGLGDFCNKCGANQNVKEARLKKRITKI